MHIPDKSLDEFIRIYKESFGEELPRGEAAAMAHRLITLYKPIMQPVPDCSPAASSHSRLKALPKRSDVLQDFVTTLAVEFRIQLLQEPIDPPPVADPAIWHSGRVGWVLFFAILAGSIVVDDSQPTCFSQGGGWLRRVNVEEFVCPAEKGSNQWFRE